MKAALQPIRVRTYLRTGSGTRLVEDRVLRPITPSERRRGVRDDYGAFVAVHGVPGARRRVASRVSHPRDWGCGPGIMLNLALQQDGTPSEEDQKVIYKMMRPHIALVVGDLVMSGIVAPGDRQDAEMAFFDVCRDSFTGWDPCRASLKTFLYERIASAKVDYVRRVKAEKSPCAHKHIGLVPSPTDDEDVQETPTSITDVVDPETIPDRHALERMLFAWALADLLDLLDPDERLALDYLLQDYTQSEVAEWMGLSLMRFRRHVLRSLQQKTEFCGFVPYNGSVVERG